MATTSPFDLTGRSAVVTGAPSGIGHAIAVALARAGADVTGMSLEPAPETEKRVAATGRAAAMIVGDTGSSEDVERLAAMAVERFGGVDIWVNNAAAILIRPLLTRPTRTGTDCWRPTCTATSTAAARRHG